MFLVPETETFVDEVAQLSPSKSTQKSFQVDPPSSVLTCSSQVASCQQILRGGIQLSRSKWISWLDVYRKETASKFVDNNSLLIFLVTSPFVIFSSCDLCTFFWQDSFGQGSFVSSSFNLSWNQWRPKSSDLLRDEVTLAPFLELPIVKWNAGMSAAQKWRARKSSLFDKNSFFQRTKKTELSKEAWSSSLINFLSSSGHHWTFLVTTKSTQIQSFTQVCFRIKTGWAWVKTALKLFGFC